MRQHIDRPAGLTAPAQKRNGVRPAVTKRGHQVAENSAELKRALMGTIGRPYV